MKKSSSRSGLSQGVLCATTKDTGRNLSASFTNPDPTVNLFAAFNELALPSDHVTENGDTKEDISPTPQVLVTETNKKDDTTGGEVETKTFQTRSPARVVLHSPTSHEGFVPENLVDIDKPTQSTLGNELGKINIATPATSENEAGGNDMLKSNTVNDEGSGAIQSLDENKGKVCLESSKDNSLETSKMKKMKGSTKKKRYLPVQSRYKQPTTKDNSLELSVIPPRTNAKRPSSVLKKGDRRSHSTPYLKLVDETQKPVADGSILDITAFKMRAQEERKESKPPAKDMKTKTGITKSGHNLSAKKDNSSALQKKISSSDLQKKRKGKENVPLTQLQLDLHYARNLQMSYMLCKAKQTLDIQEKKAKTELYGVWSANRKIEKEIQILKDAFEMKELDIAIDRLLQAQVNGLELVDDRFSKVVTTTSKLTDALENISHYLSIKNVIINEGKLMTSLEESEKLLVEITALTRSNQPGVEELATTADALKKTLASLINEINLSYEDLTTASSLVNHERSLQVHTLHGNS